MYRCMYLLVLPSLYAFLLEPNNQQNATGGQIMSSNHYLTIARFLEAQQEQHRDTEKLHKTMDDTIAVLASQLQSKFADLERKLISDAKKNETCRGVDDLEKKFIELENNYTTVLYELQIAKDENAIMKHRFSILMNETYRVDERVKQVEQLKSVQSLQDLQTIHHQIHSINAQTLSLSQNQFARNQDFLALYNQTSIRFVHAEDRLQNLENLSNSSLTNTKLTQQQTAHSILLIKDRLQQCLNLSMSNTKNLQQTSKDFSQKTFDLENIVNKTTLTLQTQVAITACQKGDANEQGHYIVKFDTVKVSLGVSDPSSFRSSGKFKCEHEGVYLVSVSLTAYSTLIDYLLKLNGNDYTRVYEQNNKVFYQRGATTVILNLHANDMVWIELNQAMYVDGVASCISIILIK